jgi:DNA-binding transcriptional ArsR family regulator
MSEEIKNMLSRVEMRLEEISSKMDTLISLMKLSQKQAVQAMRRNFSGVEHDVYSLCDGTRTVSEIANILGKSIQQISIYLSKLEEEGIVISKRKGKQKYYERVL